MFFFSRIYPHIALLVYPLATVMQTASVYLTMTVSLERYVAVCHPLRARSLCTYGRARIYVIVIVAFSTLYNVPRLWEAKVKSEWSNQFNTTVYCPVQSDFRDNKFYRTVYIHWMYLICMYLVPFLALAILNAAIYNQVSFFLIRIHLFIRYYALWLRLPIYDRTAYSESVTGPKPSLIFKDCVM